MSAPVPLCCLNEDETKLLCSLPGIEQSLLGLVQSLAAHVSESRDREVRLHRRVGELSSQVRELKEELTNLKDSAITIKDPLGLAQPSFAAKQRMSKEKRVLSRTRTGAKNEDPVEVPIAEETGNISRSTTLETDADTGASADNANFQSVKRSSPRRAKPEPELIIISDDTWKLVSAET